MSTNDSTAVHTAIQVLTQVLVESKWETTMIPMAGSEDPQRSGETTTPRFHIAVTPALVSWLQERCACATWGRTDTTPTQQTDQGVRDFLVFQTDVVEQLMECKENLHLLGLLAETQELRAFLVGAGLPTLLAKTAALVSEEQSPNAATQEQEYVHNWMWVLHNHIYFMKDEHIYPNVVASVALQLTRVAGDFRRIRTIYALQIVERIALRKTAASQKLLAPVLQTVVEFCRQQVQAAVQGSNRRGGAVQIVFLHKCCVTLSSLAFSFPSREDDWTRHCVDYLFSYKMLSPLTGQTLERLSSHVEEPSRRHLNRTGHLRPGESLHMYLGMCASSNFRTRIVGGVALGAVLAALHPPVAFGLPPLNASVASTSLYTQQALERRLQWTIARHHSLDYNGNRAGDDELLQRRLEQWKQHCRGPHALLAETVLCLAHDPHSQVGKLGRIVQNFLPRHVQQQVVWNPAIHAYFCERSKRMVMCALLMARQTRKNGSDHGALPVLAADIWITHILPFACTAAED